MADTGPDIDPRRAPTQPSMAPYPGAPPVTGAKKRRARWPWIVLAVIAAGLLVWFCVPHGQKGGAGGGPGGGRGGRGGLSTTVGAARVTSGDVPITLDELGTVTPVQTVVVRTQINGQLQSLGFQEGQMVRRGQFLAQVDPRPYQQQLAQAQGQLARDQALLANTRLDLARYQTLLVQDSIARQQVDTQASLVRQYEGAIRTDQAAVESAKLNIAYTRILSPVNGRVGLRAVDPGNYVTAGDANGIVTVAQIDPVDVLFTLPQDTLPQVTARTRTGAVLAATAFDRNRTSALAQGRLLTVDNAVDVNTGTIRAKARFPNGGGTLFPSQFVNVRLTVDTLRNATTAPTAAVLRGQQGLFVYVVDLATRKAAIRTVKTGPAAGELTSVTEGLQPGEVVVTDGTDRLRDGACVILPGDRIPTMGAGGRGRRGGGGQGAGGQGGGSQGGGGQGGGGQGGAQGGGQSGGGAGQAGGAPGGRCPNAGKPWTGPPAKGAQPEATPSAGTQSRTETRTVSTATQQAGGQGGDQGGGGQGGGGQGGGGEGGGGGRMLAALGLDAGQMAKAQAIFARHQPSDPEDPDARREARRAAMQEIMPLLRPDQKAKLEAMRAQRGQGGGGGQGGPDQ